MTIADFFIERIEGLLLPALPGVLHTADGKWTHHQCPHCKGGAISIEVLEHGAPRIECEKGCTYAKILQGLGITRTAFEAGVEHTEKSTEFLTPRHREELHKSGLSDDYIKRLGWYSETCAPKVKDLLNNKSLKAGTCYGLVIPYRNLAGEPIDYCEFKPDVPRLNAKSKKPIKYEAPCGTPRRVFFPPGTGEKVRDPKCEVLITEGAKKAASADQAGYCCVGLAGVDCWKLKDHERVNRDLQKIEWNGRPVAICFDSDIVDKPEVQGAESRLAAALEKLGAVVRVVRFPPGPQGEGGKTTKVGLDDFLVQHGPVELRKLIDEAGEPVPLDETLEKIDAKHLDQIPTAQSFYESQFSIQRGDQHIATLRWHREDWLRYSVGNGCYEVVGDWAVRTALLKYLTEFASKITQRATGDLLHALKALLFVRDSLEMPGWLNSSADNPPPFPASEVIAVKNGLIHLPSLLAGRDDFLINHTPDFWSTNCLDIPFEPEAPEPVEWMKFLQSAWKEDQDSINCLAEIIGYLISGKTDLQKLFMLVGVMRSGKGTIAKIITRLLGQANVCNPTLTSLEGMFGLQPLIGKTVGIIGDAHLSGHANQATIVERLKSISGEDNQTVDRKNREAWTGKLPTRFVLMTNELPKLADSSGAFASRIVMLVMPESFLGREDLQLEHKLYAELPAIFKWSLDGLKRLVARGRFIQPAAASELVGEMKSLSSPIGRFIDECCVTGIDATVRKADLFDTWRAWSEIQGKDHPSDAATFGRNLRAAMPAVKDSQPRVDGGRVHSYRMLGLNEPAGSALAAFREIQAKGGSQKLSVLLRQWLDAAESEIKVHTVQTGEDEPDLRTILAGFGTGGTGANDISASVKSENERNRAKEAPIEPITPNSEIQEGQNANLPVPPNPAVPGLELLHTDDNCSCTEGWRHPNGQFFCSKCIPCGFPAEGIGAAAS